MRVRHLRLLVDDPVRRGPQVRRGSLHQRGRDRRLRQTLPGQPLQPRAAPARAGARVRELGPLHEPRPGRRGPRARQRPHLRRDPQQLRRAHLVQNAGELSVPSVYSDGNLCRDGRER